MSIEDMQQKEKKGESHGHLLPTAAIRVSLNLEGESEEEVENG